jgi:hypothetical protein
MKGHILQLHYRCYADITIAHPPPTPSTHSSNLTYTDARPYFRFPPIPNQRLNRRVFDSLTGALGRRCSPPYTGEKKSLGMTGTRMGGVCVATVRGGRVATVRGCGDGAAAAECGRLGSGEEGDGEGRGRDGV